MMVDNFSHQRCTLSFRCLSELFDLGTQSRGNTGLDGTVSVRHAQSPLTKLQDLALRSALVAKLHGEEGQVRSLHDKTC